MIKYITHHEIDKTKWDICIEQSANSLVYGYSWYLDIVAPQWHALVLNNYEAVMPLTANRKLFINYLYQPFFTQQLGVFYTPFYTQTLIHDFIDAIPSKYKFIDININDQNEIESTKYNIKKRKNFVLDLNFTYDYLHKYFDDHCKRNIKKAKKETYSIQLLDPALAVAFYQKHKAQNTTNILDKDYQNLLQLLLKANEKKFLLSRGVFTENNELIAISVFIMQRGRIIYLLGGASEIGRDRRAMYRLFDDLIHQFSCHAFVLDFEGSEIPGIARFFKGFGAKKQPYFKLHINRLPWFMKWLK